MNKFSDEQKSASSFNILSGVRDAISIAMGQQPPTYEKALKHIKDIDSEIYNAIIKHLPGKNPSDLVTRFIDILNRFNLEELPEEYYDKLNKLLFFINSIAHGETSISVSINNIVFFSHLIK